MALSIRFTAEYFDTKTGEVIESKILREDVIKKPTTIKELGYMHEEQIAIIKSIQDFKLGYEARLLNDMADCPICGNKTNSHGARESNFHAALTDHKVKIQRRSCNCGWSSPNTVESVYGLSLHPDLIEKQVAQGTENSYRQASRQLNAESKNIRSINNDDRIRRNVGSISKLVVAQKLKPRKAPPKNDAAEQLTVVVDGGHLKSKSTNSRSFEAMIATVYHPKNHRRIDKYHNEITKKTSVASALSDHQQTIKQLVLNACRAEGCNARVTELTCLTDGASNCWSIANYLKPYCKELVNILDWFHITKRFTIINNRLDVNQRDNFEKIKWFLWHGNVKDALLRLTQFQSVVDEDKLALALQELYGYIDRNRNYVANYQKRCSKNLPFTSTYAESSVNNVINSRQKNDRKMQWTREGAHNILQIRTSKFSKTWEDDWNKAQEHLYKHAV